MKEDNAWFYNLMGEAKGPYSSIQIRQLANDGVISPDSLIRKGLDGRWTHARNIKGLNFSHTAANNVMPQKPTVPPPGPTAAKTPQKKSQPKSEAEGMSRGMLITLFSVVGFFVLAAILFVFWYSNSARQAKIVNANKRILGAVASANEWLGGQSRESPETLERELTEALANDLADQKSEGMATLEKVKLRREQLAEQALAKNAGEILLNATKQFDANKIPDGIALLRKYIEQPHATEKGEAQALLAAAETAISDTLILEVLMKMDDQAFERVKTSGAMDNVASDLPGIVAARNQTISRNLDTAALRREEIRTEEKRQREAEEARMREAEQLIKTEAEARAAGRRNPPVALFKDVVNFPEDYLGKFQKFESVWISGDFERQKDENLFTLRVRSEDGKSTWSSSITGKDLVFVVSEDFGRELDSALAADSSFKANICCELLKIEETPVGRIYRVETLNVSGGIADEYEDKLDGLDLTKSRVPIARATGSTRENPKIALFNDVLNFPEDYMGGFLMIESVWMHNDFERHEEEGVFSVDVSGEDGKTTWGGDIGGDHLKFVFSESFGRELSLAFEADAKNKVNLHCEISELDGTPVAKVYRIETLNLNGAVVNTFEAK